MSDYSLEAGPEDTPARNRGQLAGAGRAAHPDGALALEMLMQSIRVCNSKKGGAAPGIDWLQVICASKNIGWRARILHGLWRDSPVRL